MATEEIRKSPSGPKVEVVVPPIPESDFEPLLRQAYLDSTSVAAGENGSIGDPFKTWANLIDFLEPGDVGPWLLSLTALTTDASGTPIPDMNSDQSPTIVFQGVNGGAGFNQQTNLSNLIVASQGTGGNIHLAFRNIDVTGITFPGTYQFVLIDVIDGTLSGVSSSGTVTGTTRLVNCFASGLDLADQTLVMSGGQLSGTNAFTTATLVGTLLNGCALTVEGDLTLRNVSFTGSCSLGFSSSSQTLIVDVATYEALLIAAVTFPGSSPTLIVLGDAIPIIDEANTTRTPTKSDAGQLTRCTNAAGCVVTLNNGVFSRGDILTYRQVGAAAVSFAGTVTITPPVTKVNTTAEQGATISIVFTSGTTAESMGELSDA